MDATEPELTFLLGMSFQLLLAEFVRRVEAAGYPDLRPVHGAVFQALKLGGLTGTELAAQLGVTKQAAGQMADELERRGYVRRDEHPAGGRRRLIVLTDRATAHLAVAGRIIHDLEAELADRLGHDEVARLRGGLQNVIGAIHGGPLPPLRPGW